MTVIVEPVNMAVSIDAARTAARVDGTALDAEIEMWVRAFTTEAEHKTGRALIEQTRQELLDRFDGAIRLPGVPVKSIVVKFIGTEGVEQTLDPVDYIIDPARAGYIVPAPGKAWPSTQARVNAVTVNVVCGYGPDHTTTPYGFKAYIIGKVAERYLGQAAPYLDGQIQPYKEYG